LFIGRRDRERDQVAQRIDSRMHFRTVAPLVPVIPGAWPGFAAALQGAAVQNDGAGLTPAALTDANNRAHVADHCLKAARLIPAPELLIHRRPRQQIVGQHAPCSACAGQPPKGVEHFAQAVPPLGCLLVNQGKVRRHEVPLLVTHVTGIGLSGHPQELGATRKNQP